MINLINFCIHEGIKSTKKCFLIVLTSRYPYAKKIKRVLVYEIQNCIIFGKIGWRVKEIK